MPASKVKINGDMIHPTDNYRKYILFMDEMMTPVSIEEINKLVGLQLGRRNVNGNQRLIEDLGAESADVANLVATVEEKYKITIKESEIARILTPNDLFELVRSRAK